MGTQNMRSRYPIPHGEIKYYPDILRANGYYCANYPKTDYNIGGRPDKACWDNPGPVDWEALKKHQPFFQVINCGMSHESQAKYRLDKTRHSPDDVVLHKYHPDDPTIRKNYARYYDCVANMDGFEAKQLKALEEAGLAENTIVIYCSDHGGVLPRSKRFLFDSGLHSPLIIRIPEKFKTARVMDENLNIF
jgi:arylsulfatase A-like enzyme